jgi:hypothetical protein
VMFVDLMGREKALIMILDRFNYLWAFFDNLYSFDTHTIFWKVTLNTEMWNIKLNKSIRKKALFIDENWKTSWSWKKIVIEWKDIWLADIWNILYWYNGRKAWYWSIMLKTGWLIATSKWYDDGYKKTIIWNEKDDWKFYEAGINLADNTKSWEITREVLLETYFNIFPNGR